MKNWTVADFLTYLYQLVAEADFQTVEQEITIVKRQVAWVLANYFGELNYSYAESLKRIQETEGVNLLNCKEVLQELMPRFEFSQTVKKDIVTDLLAIASADNSVSPSEKETLRFIEQQFNATEMPLSW